MGESDKSEGSSGAEGLAAPSTSPLVFISHDARDYELAEAFSKFLKSISAGMIKTFRSSGRSGAEGIDFGDEWYKRLMSKLQTTSDVVCLFTERSLNRPWILFEAGVAKGKLNTPVVGIALGIPLGRVTAGPFYQFQNMDDSEADLTKLAHQLARRVPGLELDHDVVALQVEAFKKAEADILEGLSPGGGSEPDGDSDETAVAKLVEEMKALPSRVAERVSDVADPMHRRRMRRFHPMMFDELLHMSGDPSDPVAILIGASLLKDDAPWLYELGMEAYRAAKSQDVQSIEREMVRLNRFSDMMMRSSFLEEFGIGGPDGHMLMVEFPKMLERLLHSSLSGAAPRSRPRPSKKKVDAG